MDFYNLDDLLLMSARDVTSTDPEPPSMNVADSTADPARDMSFEGDVGSEDTQKSDDFDYDFLNLEPVRRDRANTWHGRAPVSAVKDGASSSPMSGGEGKEKIFNDDLAVVRRKVATRRNAWGNQSYADLICKAIESSPEQRLTLSQIYNWMVQNVPFFTDKGDSNSSAGWKNSIRHNLSLHSRFKRVQNEGTGKSSWWVINTEARTTRAPRRRAATMDPQAYEKRRHGRGASRRLTSALSSDAHHGGVLSSLALEHTNNPAAFLMSPSCDPSLELSPLSFSLSPQDFRTRTGSNASSIGGGRLSPIQAEPDMYPDTGVAAPSWMDNCRSGYQTTSPLAAGYQGGAGHADSLAETLGKSLTGIFDSGSDYASAPPVILQNGKRQSSPASHHHSATVVGGSTGGGYIPVPTSCYLLNQQQHPPLYRIGMSSNAGGGVYGESCVSSIDYFNSPCHPASVGSVGRNTTSKVEVPMICIGGNVSGAGLVVNDTMARAQSFGTLLQSHNRQPLDMQQMTGHPGLAHVQGQHMKGHQVQGPLQLQQMPGQQRMLGQQMTAGLQRQLLLQQGGQVPRQQANQIQWNLVNLMQQQQQPSPSQDCQKSQTKPLSHPAIDRQALIRLLSEKPHLKEKIKQLLAEKSQLRSNNASPNAAQLRNTPNPPAVQSSLKLTVPGAGTYPLDWQAVSTQPQATVFPEKAEQGDRVMLSGANGSSCSNALPLNEGSTAAANVKLPKDLDFDFHPSYDIECDINQIISYDSLCFDDSFDFAEFSDEASAPNLFDDFSDMLN